MKKLETFEYKAVRVFNEGYFVNFIYTKDSFTKAPIHKETLILKTQYPNFAKIFADKLNEELMDGNKNLSEIQELLKIKMKALRISIEISKEDFKVALQYDTIFNTDSAHYKQLLVNEKTMLEKELEIARIDFARLQIKGNSKLRAAL
jgi:hypothetical protein